MIYLATVQLTDGFGHEHFQHGFIREESEQRAAQFVKDQCADEEAGYWSYGDGMYHIKFVSVQKASIALVSLCEQFGLAFPVNFPFSNERKEDTANTTN